MEPKNLPWIAPGDINGFFGLVVDNLTILAFLASALIGIFGFPAEVVFGRMFPGTALGVLVGLGLVVILAWHDTRKPPLGHVAPTRL